ncbi:MAG: radical SAM protein [Phycisphaeraceae bacterium]|nr:radical SAM protein [Phycisphaeraceae bacterium]
MRIRTLIKLVPVFARSLTSLPLRHVWYLTRQLRFEQLHIHNDRIYVNTFLPPIPSPAFDRLLNAVIHKKRVPFSTYFAITDECPFKCSHCSYGRRASGEMTTAQALDVIEQIKGLGTTTLGFSGGEPLLRQDLPKLIQAVGPDTETIIFTTGHTLDAAKAAQLRKAGLNSLMIGMESDIASTHDAVRGVPGSFDEGMEAIRLGLDAGLYTAISTVATHDKIKDNTIEKMANLARDLKVHEFRILEPVPTGRALGQTSALITPAERHTLTTFHKQWNQAKKGPAIASFSHLESDAMFGCGAGYHHLYIDACGEVCPCDLTPLSFGNVLNTPLATIWQQMGEVFTQPRCSCFAAKACCDLAKQSQTGSLPLPVDKTTELCQSHPCEGPLPRVYDNLS